MQTQSRKSEKNVTSENCISRDCMSVKTTNVTDVTFHYYKYFELFD